MNPLRLCSKGLAEPVMYARGTTALQHGALKIVDVVLAQACSQQDSIFLHY